ncbi:hypothetical protein OWR29_02655 [Actinoplanes sp. Pm04-4]|uniref:Uncharacterized protein n=1 Tax=Paractinoplanes pyxinae TaxID=2997416 RepID=A0ABT4ARL8_9ACTN|nr:hypothetical protein [Actinoplanes pyxinae]MCY1136882.1 hypothetical protein [Actinoplanes pyxinae]
MKRSVVLLPAAVLVLVAACGDGGGVESLPSSRPSAERTASPRPTAEPTRTRETVTAEPTRTREPATADPTRTREAVTDEPTRAQPAPTAEPARTTLPATVGPSRTAAPAPAEPARTTAPEAPAGTTPASAVAVADDSGSGGFGWLGWLLVLGLFGALVAVLLVGRSRRAAQWRAFASGLAAETRTEIHTRLPRVRAQRPTADQALSWPPVREELAGLAARWADLSTRAPDTAAQAGAAQIAGLLRDLIAAVDDFTVRAENELSRSEVDTLLDALEAALPPPPVIPPAQPGPAAYPGGEPGHI